MVDASRINCIFVFLLLVFSMLCRKYLFSCRLISTLLVLCRVSLMCSLILVVISFHPSVELFPLCWLLYSLGAYVVFSMLNLCFVMMGSYDE